MRMGSQARADQRGFTLAELLVAIAILGVIMLGVLTLLMRGNEGYLTGSNQAEAQASARAAIERMTLDIREAGYGPRTDGVCALPLPGGCFNAVTGPGGVGGPTAISFTLQMDWNGLPAPPANPIEPAVRACVAYTWAAGDPPFCLPGTVSRGEQVTYTVVGGTLCRQESAIPVVPPDPLCAAGVSLVTSVQQAISGGVLQDFFQYLDANGNVMTVAALAANPELIRTIWVQMRVGVQNQPPAIWRAGAVQVTMSDRIRLRNRI